MKSIGLIGFGRFGKTLASILQKGFIVRVYDKIPNQSMHKIETVDFESISKEEVIFISVPIRNFKAVIEKLSDKIRGDQTIIDVCSVKKYTESVMLDYLPKNAGIISTHPMFGPDSFKDSNDLKMVMCNTRDCYNQFQYWERFFQQQNIKIIKMSSDEHDRLASNTQGITHFLGRLLKEYDIRSTKIDTKGYEALLKIVEQTCNDTWELYTDLQSYNPYTNLMQEKFSKALKNLKEKQK